MAISATPPEPMFPAFLAAARRDGVWVRQDACSRYGVGRVRAELAGRRWQAPTSTVVITHNGPLTQGQRMWVVLLATPRGTVLFGLSGAVHDGLRGFEPDHLSVVMPGSSYDPRKGQLDLPDDWDVHLRWSTKLGPEDVNPAAMPPRTRLARSVVDEASEQIPERRSRALVLATVQQRRTTTAGFWDALSRRGRCRNRAIIVESIRDAEGGIESLPEREFDLLRRRLRLPEPRRQQVLQRRDGRYFLDNDWPTLGIRVEIHGIPHSEVRQWDDDLLRQNDISIQGGLLIFSSYAIRHQQARVGSQLCDMFRRRGWSG